MKRKTPIRHRVKTHTRKGKRINSFFRGKGKSRILSLRLSPTKLKISNLNDKQKKQIRKLAEDEIHRKLRNGKYPDVPAIYGKYVHIAKKRVKELSIDKNIFPLLVAMARANFQLIGSCGGHIYSTNKWTNALVYFESSPKKINELVEQTTEIHNISIIHRHGNRYSLQITTRGRKNTDNVIKRLVEVL